MPSSVFKSREIKQIDYQQTFLKDRERYTHSISFKRMHIYQEAVGSRVA